MRRVGFALVLLLCVPAPGAARTWTVERYGPADFSTIQPALDAAASGDTVQIGAGRYTEYETVTLPGWSWTVDVYAYVHCSDLTIIGDGDTETLIGPLAPNYQGFGPKGVVALESVSHLLLQGLGFENLYDGVYLLAGPLDVHQCRFRQCMFGTFYAGGSALQVRNSIFLDGPSGGAGVVCLSAGHDILIESSNFLDCAVGVDCQWATSFVVISRCFFIGGGAGIKFAGGATGVVRDCVVENPANYCISVRTESAVTLERNHLSGGAYNLTLTDFPVVGGSENVLSDATSAAIRCSQCATDFHGNHILNGGGYSVKLANYVTLPDRTVDLTGNYWGTDDPAQIAAWIWDGNDDPAIHGFVDFEPFADGPIPSEQRSWGEVKDLYRGVK